MNITIIAVGNCGYNIANDIIEAGIIVPKDYIVCDIDDSELQNKGLVTKCRPVLLQPIEGRPTTERLAVVSAIVPDDTELVVICAGMGGKTGSRFAPLIAMAAQELNKKVISVFATAFQFEGENAQMRSKWGFLQQQIASDLCIYQDNNCLNKELTLTGMNDPILSALRAIIVKRPITEWPNITTAEIKQIMFETTENYGPVMIHNFYSKDYIDAGSRKSMFDEIIMLNS